MSSQELPPHLVIPVPDEGWPARFHDVDGRRYMSLGSEIYAPTDPTIGEVQSLYGYWATEHDNPYDKQHAWIKSVGYACADLISFYLGGETDGLRLLDMACGTGLVSQGLRERLDIATHVGADLTSEMLDVARSKPDLAGVSLVIGDVRKPMFAPNSFDAITGSLFINHLGNSQDRIATFKGAREMLRPGGLFVMIDTQNNPMREQVAAEFYEAFEYAALTHEIAHVDSVAPDGFMLDYYVGQA
jgi:predicted TPR repeat methyltransferase